MLIRLDKKALIVFTVGILIAVGLVFLGARDLQNFDPALIAYLFWTLSALFGITYRYTVWIQPPITKLYFKRSFQLFFSGRFFPYMIYSFKEFLQNIAFQRFIKNGSSRTFLLSLQQ